ncbi:hypothetical protein Tco_0507989 [Tanacetum coccineum]
MLSYTYTPQPFKDLFDGRKAHLLEDKQIPSIWRKYTCLRLIWRRNGQDYGSTPKRGDGVASIKRRRRDLQSYDVKDFVTASERSRLKEDLESSTWRRRDVNPIRTLEDYSRPSHEGYRNSIELPKGNNVVPLRFDNIRLVQNGCSFHRLWSEDPNQHLKDFLKFVDSLDLDVANRDKMRLRLFQFSLRDQASNWLEHLPAGSISTWEDL